MCKKVTLLLGAGAAIPWGAPSSCEITEAIRNSQDHFVNDKTLGNWINQILIKDNTVSQKDVNFETYVDLIETVHSFLLSNKAVHPSLKNSFYKFFDLKTVINEAIHKLKSSNGSTFESDISKVADIFYSLIRIIGNKIIPYLNNYFKDDCKSLNEKLQEFCEYFLNTGYSIRAYTLNYDRSIPLVFESNSSEYVFFDGFDIGKNIGNKEQLFLLNKTKILTDIQCNSFYNLHGSFHWSFQDKEYNSSSFEVMSTKKYKYYPANLFYQDAMKTSNPNERLLQAPIITGYKKIQRINLPPFNYFFHSFFNDLFQSKIIVIVGYSFSDPHINQLIETALIEKKKVYIIDYKKEEIDEEILKFIGYNLDSYNVFERPSSNVFWAKNLGLESELYIKGFENFLIDSEWLKIQIM